MKMSDSEENHWYLDGNFESTKLADRPHFGNGRTRAFLQGAQLKNVKIQICPKKVKQIHRKSTIFVKKLNSPKLKFQQDISLSSPKFLNLNFMYILINIFCSIKNGICLPTNIWLFYILLVKYDGFLYKFDWAV